MAGVLSAWDFVCIAAVLFISAGIGIFYAVKDRLSKNKQNTDEFLSGGHKMPLLPTALSLMASFMSGIGMLSIPAEVYTGGVVYAWSAPGASLGIIFCTIFVIPVLYRVKCISMYAYVQERYDSKYLRLYSSTIFQLSSLMYMAVVLYAPSVALAALSGLPVWVWILGVGVVCTIYTSIGGLKAVVWTDTFQALIMYAGLFALVIKGTLEVGGFRAVIDRASRGGRLANAFNVDPDPFQYMTLWTSFFGAGAFTWIGVFGTSQVAMQRYRSLPSLAKARAVAFINVPAMLVIMGLIYYLGVTMFSYYVDCDPLKAGQLKSRDQLVIKYTLDVLGDIYGLPGLYLACVFSATLSTISSGINSLSAVALEDYVRLCIKPDLDEGSAVRFTKIIGLGYGVIAMALAFAADPLGGILIALMTVTGSLSGPNVGLILTGILCPWANKIGGLIGVVVSTVFTVWIFIGSQIYKSANPFLPTSIDGCPSNGTVDGQNATWIAQAGFSNATTDQSTTMIGGVAKLYRLSFVMYGFTGTMISVILCMIVSALTGGSDVRKTRPDLLYWSGTNDDDDQRPRAAKETELEKCTKTDLDEESEKQPHAMATIITAADEQPSPKWLIVSALGKRKVAPESNEQSRPQRKVSWKPDGTHPISLNSFEKKGNENENEFGEVTRM